MIERKKIVVIADDFTGAAEIGGIGLRHGLKVAIETEPTENENVDLLVVATDTRSLTASEAKKVIHDLTEKILRLNPFLIYKKIDSVLRGNVSEEIEAQLDAMKLTKSIIIAGNPTFNRIIKDGKYYIDSIPLHESDFASNSQHPIDTNEVVNLISSEIKYPLFNRKSNEIIPDEGLIIGDVERIEDLNNWSQFFSEKILFAGASIFFNFLLEGLNLSNHKSKTENIPFGKKRLFVLGSSYPKEESFLKNMIQSGHCHSNMPLEIYENENYSSETFQNWVKEVITALDKNHKVIVSSIHSNSKDRNIYKRIKLEIAKLVKEVSDETTIDEMFVEGGSTVYEILKNLNIKHLTSIQELDMGVIRMKVNSVPGLCLTTKPGSYSWPQNIWSGIEKENLNNINQ